MNEYPTLTEEELKARKKRNLILAWSLVAFMCLILAITMVKLKEGVVRDQDWAAETSKSKTVVKEEPVKTVPEKDTGDE